MRNQTDMMREIVTNETAKRIINFVSPIYGNSYAGLWIYQAIGSVLDEICKIAEQLRYETNPATSELLLDYWEDQYGIPKKDGWTVEKRQSEILKKIVSVRRSNPTSLENAVSHVINDVPVKITENIEKNTFLVIIQGSSDDITSAIHVIEQNKPAHLIYRLQSEIEAGSDLKIANVITHAENHVLETDAIFEETLETGLLPASVITHAEEFKVNIAVDVPLMDCNENLLETADGYLLLVKI